MAAASLTLPAYAYKLTPRTGAAPLIWDPVRRMNVVCTPEEWVRQHVLHYLTDHLGYPPSLLSIERGTGRLGQRTDLRAYDPGTRQPALLIECKAPEIKLTPAVLQQAQRYWQRIPARFIVITNGIQHACWEVGPPPVLWDRWPSWTEVIAD
jgi:Type I restriction enzyme R protein N terminus (HSDR_N)